MPRAFLAYLRRYPDSMKKLVSAVTMVALACSTVGCSWFESKAKVAEDDAIACVKADLGQSVEAVGVSLLMTVVSILANGGTDWSANLAALEAKYGKDAIACAEKVAADLFKPTPSATPSTSALAAGSAQAYLRATQALSGKKFR